MTQVLEFPCQVIDGRLRQEDADRIAAAIRRMDGKRLVISIKEQKRRRSNQQNRYLWGVVNAMITEVFRDAGNMVDAEDVHHFLKEHVGKLSQVIISPDGEVFKAPGSTRKLNTQEMEVYLERVRAWAAETLGLLIPLPNEALDAA